jgi:hypothetical protein
MRLAGRLRPTRSATKPPGVAVRGAGTNCRTHTVVTALSPPALVLHLDHTCFDAYRYTSGLELAAVGSSKDRPPERLEHLRITFGWDLPRFSRALGVTEERTIASSRKTPPHSDLECRRPHE